MNLLPRPSLRRAARGGLTAVVALAIPILLTACGSSDSGSGASGTTGASGARTAFTIGVQPGVPYENKVAKLAQQILAEKGVKLTIKEIADPIVLNRSLDEGSIDVNLFQQKHYLGEIATANGFHLKALEPIAVFKLAGFSKKVKTLAELPDGATIAIPNDPANEALFLRVYENLGLIKLDPGVGVLQQTVKTIASNPRNLTFKPVDFALLPRVYDDVDLTGSIASDFAVAGFDLKKAVFTVPAPLDYANVVAVREKETTDPAYQPLIDAFSDPRVAQLIDSDPEISVGAYSYGKAKTLVDSGAEG
jgi:D-methionine transport system substrate-binding protein